MKAAIFVVAICCLSVGMTGALPSLSSFVVKARNVLDYAEPASLLTKSAFKAGDVGSQPLNACGFGKLIQLLYYHVVSDFFNDNGEEVDKIKKCASLQINRLVTHICKEVNDEANDEGRAADGESADDICSQIFSGSNTNDSDEISSVSPPTTPTGSSTEGSSSEYEGPPPLVIEDPDTETKGEDSEDSEEGTPGEEKSKVAVKSKDSHAKSKTHVKSKGASKSKPAHSKSKTAHSKSKPAHSKSNASYSAHSKSKDHATSKN